MARQMTHKITLGGKQVANADESMTASIPPAFGTAFSNWNPLGFVPGRCWVVMRRKDIADLIDGSSEKHDLVITGSANESGLTGGETTFKDLYVVKATRATVGPAGSNDAPYLVELADKRFILSRFSDTGDVISNLNSFANDTTFLTNSTTNGTWATLFAALWAALPSDVAGTQPTLPSTPDGVPEDWHLHGQNAWEAIAIFLNKLDVSLSYSPHTGLFTAVQLGDAQTLPDLPVKPYHDADPLEHGSTKVPASIEVYRHVHRLSYGQERDKELAQNWALGDGHDSNTEATGKTGAVSGTVLPLWDDLKEKKDENDSTTNTAGLNTRSTNRSNNRANSLNSERVHKIFPGVHEVLPGSQVKLVLHRQLVDDRHIGGMVTEFIQGPEMIRSVGPANHTGTSIAVGWSPAGEGLQAPDLGRATYPNFPRLPEIVQVHDTGETAGDEIGPNVDGLFPGRVARWVSGSLTVLDDCWIRFIDDEDNVSGFIRVINDEYFTGRLSGVETSVATTLPIYLATSRQNTQDEICFIEDGFFETGLEYVGTRITPIGERHWDEVDGTWSISQSLDGSVTPSGAAPASGLWQRIVNACDTYPIVEINMRFVGTLGRAGILARYADEDNWWALFLNPASAGAEVELVQNKAGVQTVIDTSALAGIAVPTVFKLRIEFSHGTTTGIGDVKGFVDGKEHVQKTSVQHDAGSPRFFANGLIADGTDANFFDFKVCSHVQVVDTYWAVLEETIQRRDDTKMFKGTASVHALERVSGDLTHRVLVDTGFDVEVFNPTVFEMVNGALVEIRHDKNAWYVSNYSQAGDQISSGTLVLKAVTGGGSAAWDGDDFTLDSLRDPFIKITAGGAGGIEFTIDGEFEFFIQIPVTLTSVTLPDFSDTDTGGDTFVVPGGERLGAITLVLTVNGVTASPPVFFRQVCSEDTPTSIASDDMIGGSFIFEANRGDILTFTATHRNRKLFTTETSSWAASSWYCRPVGRNELLGSTGNWFGADTP